MKRHILFILTLLLAVPLSIYSVPAKPGVKKTLTLPDGTKVVAELVGDEFGSYWRGTDGKAYSLLPGKDVYKVVDAKQIMQFSKERRTLANKESSMRRLARQNMRKVSSSITGQKKSLIILVNFKDVKFQESNNKELYEKITNKVGFSEGPFKGSVHDYFYDQSLGASERFELSFDVVGPYTLSKEMAYYGEQYEIDKKKIDDRHPGEMVTEAIKLAEADKSANVNFADYVWNSGNKEVELVFVIYAGTNQAEYGGENTIWPHKSSLSNEKKFRNDGSGALTIDGVTIDTYACSSELNGDGNIAGIGTICHEFSHCLGLPDTYDTEYNGGQGMGYWDLMSKGNYNGDGYQPAGYTSFERWFIGWKEPVELSSDRSVNGMNPLQESGESYVIYNSGHANEFFLLENRQKTGWDASLPGKGLLITHVDYDKNAWDRNDINVVPTHQRQTWIPADNVYNSIVNEENKISHTFDGMATDTYPYDDNDFFNRYSKPAASLYNANIYGERFLESSVENITQNYDGTMSFDYHESADYLKVTSYGFEEWDLIEGCFHGTTLKGSVTLQNNSDINVKKTIKVWLIDLDGFDNSMIMRYYPINIDIPPHEIIEYEFQFMNLIEEHTYYVSIYDNNGELVKSELMLCKDDVDIDETIEGNENLASFEYWFDDNSDTRVEVMLNNNRATVKESIYPDFLDDGVHRLNFRVKRNDGMYSSVSSSSFLKLPREQESRVDYWLDDDLDNKQTLEIENTEDEQLLTLDFSDNAKFSYGFHKLNMKMTLKGSLSGTVISQGLMKLPTGFANELEYWFDNDIAHAQRLTGKRAETGEAGFIYVNELDLSALPVGIHTLNMRAVSPSGLIKSSVFSYPVMKLPMGQATQVEYWFDNDIANPQRLNGKRAEAGEPGFIYVNELDLSALPIGIHTLNFRAVSPSGTIKSSIISQPVMKLPMSQVGQLEYWFDGDIAHSHTLSGSGDAMSLTGCLFTGDLDLTGITPGHHRLYYRAKSSNGQTATSIGSAAIMVKSQYGADGEATMASYSVIVDDELVSYGPLAARQEVTFSYALDTKDLTPGVHKLKTTFWNSFGLSVTEQVPFKVVEGIHGDVNCDGGVDVADIATIIDVMAGNA
ncbi:MAG: M6 family metalloprotease domain-containing protein, partial [Prevotella sp.]|nr:M6 family metalloprotease domain-containing protein [Prevotella sp.]